MPYGTRSRQTGGDATGGGAAGSGGSTGGGAVALEEAAAAKPSTAKVARLSSELRLLREANEVAPGQRLAWDGEAPELGDADEEVTNPDCKPSSNLRPRAANAPSAPASTSAAPRAPKSSLSAARKRPRSTPPRLEPAADIEADDGVGDEELAGAEYPPYSELVGSDVCVLAAAYPDAAERLGADRVGWRGAVSAKRGGGLRNAQVTVFGSWFALSDTTRLQPILQEGGEDEGSSDDDNDVFARVQAAARKRRKPAELCLRSDKCSMPTGHAGWCNKRSAAGKALGQVPDTSDEDEAVATEPVADVVARVQAAARERRPQLPLEPADPRPDMVLARQLFGFLKPRYASDEGSNPRLADPRQTCYSHVRASPWTAWTI
jgi:hypothetical protein